MRISMLLETALKSIKNNRRRSLLTMVGLIIGTAAVITILSVGRGYEQYQRNRLLPDSDGNTIKTTIGFTANDAEFDATNLASFTASDFDLIEMVEGVLAVEYEKIDSEKDYRTQGLKLRDYNKSTKAQLVYSDGKPVISGRKITKADVVNQNKVAVISEELVKEVIDDSESLLGETLKIGSENLLIVGIFRSSIGDALVQIPKSTYEYYFGVSEPKKISVTISNKFSSSIIGKQIVDILSEQGSVHRMGTYSNSSGAALADSLSAMFQSLTLLISFVGGVSLFISGVGVMNMIYTSVSERVKEIGVRRAMGATEFTIQMQFLLEGLTLTIIGGMIGYIIGLLLAKAISLAMNFSFIPDLFTAGLAILISVLVGVIFSYFPSKSATEKDIVDLIR